VPIQVNKPKKVKKNKKTKNLHDENFYDEFMKEYTHEEEKSSVSKSLIPGHVQSSYYNDNAIGGSDDDDEVNTGNHYSARLKLEAAERKLMKQKQVRKVIMS
jgi:hypothetical protein